MGGEGGQFSRCGSGKMTFKEQKTLQLWVSLRQQDLTLKSVISSGLLFYSPDRAGLAPEESFPAKADFGYPCSPENARRGASPRGNDPRDHVPSSPERTIWLVRADHPAPVVVDMTTFC